jgi:PAS domain S-box-containing protein
MWICDYETQRFLLVNDAAVEHYGYSREELLSMTLKEIRPAEDLALLSVALRNEAESGGAGKGTRGIWRHRKKNGQIIDVEVTGNELQFQGRRARLGLAYDITERRQSEQTLYHIMEGAHCLHWQAEIVDVGAEHLQWTIQIASEQAAQRFLPLDVPAGTPYSDAWYFSRPVEDRDRSNIYAEREIRANRSYQQEFRCHSKEGALHWLSENVRVETVSAGRWHCIGVCTDVTERKLAEEATRAMTRGAQCLLWYAFVEERPDGLHWDVEMADEEAAWQFFPVARSPGMSYHHASARARLPEDDTAMGARARAALLGGQREYTHQFRCLRADGEWRWQNETVRVEALSPGRWHCVGVCTDITDQKRAEEERDRFFTLSLDLLCVMAPNGHFVRLNPAFETLLGYTQAELMARPLLDFVYPDDREVTIARIASVQAGSFEPHFENRYLCRDGSYRWFSWTSTAFQGFLYSVGHDITLIREAKDTLRNANEELEARVAQRTAQIMEVNAQLIMAKLEAERANHAKSEFLSRMSHELRTPLNAILGFGQILDRQPLTPLQGESVQYILTGGRHLLSLINEVLDLARVEAGHIELSLEPIALIRIVSESCALIGPLAAEGNISLDADFALGGSYVLADRQRLQQVLLNLLSNAVKYNRPGGQVRVKCLPGSNDCLRIAIQDTGPGITPEDQQKLFVPFERLNADRSGVEGTGLGLALSRRLVTAMGGLLTLESVHGEGATFFLDLPQAIMPVETQTDPIGGVGAIEAQSPETPSVTILIIEDNLSNMRLLEVLLRSRSGVTLLPAMQGSVGLDLARQHTPDLILLDLNLPDISGKEVLARLQASPVTRGIPVIILSADATVSQIERLMSAGASAYLTKPLDVPEFLCTLDAMLPNKRAGETPAPVFVA